MNKNTREYFVWTAAKHAAANGHSVLMNFPRIGINDVACISLDIAENLVSEFEQRYGALPTGEKDPA